MFRAVVYNKGAAVLHMLRRLIGDEAFFNGLRRFYAACYRKAGTDDLRQSMEARKRPGPRAFLRPLGPRYRAAAGADHDRDQGRTLEVAYEQLGETFDVPVTVTLQYADGTSEDIVIPMIDEAGTHVVPLRGALRNVEIYRDDAALGTLSGARAVGPLFGPAPRSILLTGHDFRRATRQDPRHCMV